MIKHLLTGLFAVGLTYGAMAQTTFPRNGVYDERPGLYAFTNATIIVDPQTTLQNATLLVRNGRVEAVGANVSLPAGTVVADLKGKRIYPAMVEIDSDYGMPELKREQRGGGRAPQQLESAKKGPYYWNQAVQPENDASALFKADDKKADELRKIGFGAVLTHPHDGVVRGTGALVTLADDRENLVLLKANVTAHYSFNKGSSGQSYPNSMMGSVALLRQAMYDADWYKRGGNKEQANTSLEALTRIQSLPAIFDAGDKLGILRADKVGDEFGVQYILRGTGDEYQRINEIKATGASLIVPVSFPQPYDVEDAWDADNVSLSELKHWEMAPMNAGRLAGANISFALTTSGLKNKADFWANIRKAIENGLTEQKALEALTTVPARLMKADDQVGTLQKGRVANFIITSGNLFGADNVIYENWIRGKQYIVNEKNAADLRGKWALTVGERTGLTLNITGKSADKPEYQIVADTIKSTPKVAVSGDLISIQLQLDKKQPGTTRLTGYQTSPANLKGDGETPDGKRVAWSAVRAAGSPVSTTATSVSAVATLPASATALLYPFVGMGNTSKPVPQTMMIRNATVWTNEKDGILPNTDVFVTGGKITKVGKNLPVPADVAVVDGTGKHLTTGIIDEHSHIALLSVNEGSQSSTAEVRMADVVNSEDVNIYRQLAGGVTASQLLHGSANAIGGQSAIVKLKWGESPDAMMLKGADGFIKFALGENVKQSNWGDVNRVRFPQTRMGVEQVYMDHFMRAKEYAKSWATYNGLNAKQKASAVAPHRDIELDALAEILAAKRFITCHSYVQSEINMLMHVADSLGFKVNTFTHILEGYKLADKMAKHGAGGSSFADWWAYKMEVHDAIPYNAALMHRQGVTVSINSDDAEMARRLNQEAAKTIEYGGMTEEDAWKMVTLNPAKLLHLDSRMGSIRVGKDADLVLWNANPLAIYARPEKTIIDGAVYFDLASEDRKRDAMQAERARLIQKMITAKASGSPTTRPGFKRARMWHCEDIEGLMAEGEEEEQTQTQK
ncbi:amidohydrolase family protein [Spirosoma utsteinense]|uniref:Imidazolonepropionase-like amidohydrolase n=1 Tax=Spirosoma utsteinense TaxID=2585773 RepID=A0ABR6WBL4_9BACT|nr:amidohydrolase family protein [Spirosoma utsteinense]MBC3788072.1 imidazolonepropionase-like amidohydrolase [Spirosoma utsteinense]MBC3793957.1 imidazolonepropionase-like amidohydrolase [Spirosoma utsteinense]